MAQPKPWKDLPALLEPLPPPPSFLLDDHPDIVKVWQIANSYYATFPEDLDKLHGVRNQTLKGYAPYIILCFRYLMLAGANRLRKSTSHTEKCYLFSAVKHADSQWTEPPGAEKFSRDDPNNNSVILNLIRPYQQKFDDGTWWIKLACQTAEMLFEDRQKYLRLQDAQVPTIPRNKHSEICTHLKDIYHTVDLYQKEAALTAHGVIASYCIDKKLASLEKWLEESPVNCETVVDEALEMIESQAQDKISRETVRDRKRKRASRK